MGDSAQNADNKRKNRKRKKSVLKNARKYAKQGTFGRGSHLTEDTYQYFVRILEAYKEGFATDEEKLIFVNNVFEQTENEEINYSCNQIGCRVIETLLPFASYDVLKLYTEKFSEDLRPLCSDRFASHVLQALLNVSCARSLSEPDDDNKKLYRDFSIKISKFLLNNLEDYIVDTYGNHIIRTVFTSFAQIPKDDKSTLDTVKHDIPAEYADIITDYAERLSSWPHFKDLPYNELSSGLLQVLLRALQKTNIKLLRSVIKKLLDDSFSVVTPTDTEDDVQSLPDVFRSKPATMLLETALTVAAPKSFTQLYARCFVGKLATLAKIKDNNFTVQKLLNFCQEKEEFESMFDELSDHFEEILVKGFTGVILSVAQACKRLGAKQGNFVQQLMKALHCFEPQDRQNTFIALTIRLVPYERLAAVQTQHYFVNLHGSIILQLMLEFNKPIKIVNSLLSMEANDLKQLFCDSKGSHIVDSYVKSTYVGEKSREKLIRKMQGCFQEMAAGKYGSRSFESIWSVCNDKQRQYIMDELCYKDASWSNGEFGRIIANKLNVQLYKRNKEDWKQFQGKTIKTKSLFADIIDCNDK